MRLHGGLTIDGVAAQPPVETLVFSSGGPTPGIPLTVRSGTHRLYLEGSYLVESVRASVGTAPTGSGVTVDVNKNGTTIYTTQSARPQIAAGASTATGNSPAVTTLTAGDYLTVDVDAIGSTVAGADLTVAIRLRRTG